MIHTLQEAPESQYADILELLMAERYALLKTLIRKFHNQLIGQDNFDRLIDAVTVMIQKTYVYEHFEQDIAEDRVLRWGSDDLFHGFEFHTNDWVNAAESESITFSSSSLIHHYPGGSEYTGVRIESVEKTNTPLDAAPFDFVPLKLYDDIALESGRSIITKNNGEFQAIPAIYMYWMLERKATDETLAAISANVNGALFIIGGAEIIAAKSALRLTLAIVDEATFATSFLLAAGPRQILEEGPNGAEWQSIFKAFDAFNLLYGVARMGEGLALAADNILAQRPVLNHLKETEDWTRLTPGQRSVINGEIVRIEEGMDELGRRLEIKVVTMNADAVAALLNKLPTDVQARVKQLPSDQMAELLSDLNSSSNLMSKLTVESVDGWEVLSKNAVLRKRPENLEILGGWIAKGVDKERLAIGIGKATAKQDVIDKIKKASSSLHVSVIIRDWEVIPGIKRGRYVPNGSKMIDKHTMPASWPSRYDIDAKIIDGFTGEVTPLELKAGDVIYRVSNSNGGGGPWWTATKPTTLEEVVGGTAVRPQWNNFEYIYEYRVPEGVTIRCWVGKAARQQVENDIKANFHLPGGDEQIYILRISEQDPNFVNTLIQEKAQW